MSVISQYQQQLASTQISPDENQLTVVHQLQQISEQLTQAESRQHSWFNFSKPKPINGLYLWGSVGIGKTFLMDLFYNNLPIEKKSRWHFHQFMQMIHQQLTQLQGNADPLAIIAKKIASKTKVLCFDELIVNNIVDAMLLAELFRALYKENICILFTSNCAPDGLYKNGLQRQRFLPAIQLIEQHSTVFHLVTTTDYRQQFINQAKFYFYPITAETNSKMEEIFGFFSHHAAPEFEPLTIYHRSLQIRKQADKVIWCDFLDICGIPRSQTDYLILANNYHTVMISNLTPIQSYQNDLAQSFIKLIDVLYDAKINLVIAATVPIEKIYPKGIMRFEFARTESRLVEMQSTAYINDR